MRWNWQITNRVDGINYVDAERIKDLSWWHEY